MGGANQNPGRKKGSSSDTSPKTVSFRHGTQAAGDEVRFEASSTDRGGRGGAPQLVSTDYEGKFAGERAKGVEYKGRETMSKRDKTNALLAQYQQRLIFFYCPAPVPLHTSVVPSSDMKMRRRETALQPSVCVCVWWGGYMCV